MRQNGRSFAGLIPRCVWYRDVGCLSRPTHHDRLFQSHTQALFGDINTHQTATLPQAESYVHRFGPGMVLYWFGHAPLDRLGDAQGDIVIGGWELPDTFMLPTGEIVERNKWSPLSTSHGIVLFQQRYLRRWPRRWKRLKKPWRAVPWQYLQSWEGCVSCQGKVASWPRPALFCLFRLSHQNAGPVVISI